MRPRVWTALVELLGRLLKRYESNPSIKFLFFKIHSSSPQFSLPISFLNKMAHPVLWPKKTFFYPIGNTAPSCFTRDLAPEIDADILLLGCGDPRSILYTIHSDHCPCKRLHLADLFISNQDIKADRKLDFTCCDAEPAILGLEIVIRL